MKIRKRGGRGTKFLPKAVRRAAADFVRQLKRGVRSVSHAITAHCISIQHSSFDSIGLMGSMEPINVDKNIFEPIDM